MFYVHLDQEDDDHTNLYIGSNKMIYKGCILFKFEVYLKKR